MKSSLAAITLLLSLALAGCWKNNSEQATGTISPLELVNAYAVDISRPLEPSGLVIWNDELFTVADKDNYTIYRIVLTEGSCRLDPALEFQPPSGYSMDWEGITVDNVGNFYLISETYSRIARVTRDGKCEWISPDLSNKASEIGLFTGANAGFEGITWLGTDHWLGAVEREPRGLVEFRIDGSNQLIHPSVLEQSPFSNVLNILRIPDYSGLSTDESTIYALFRNAHLVVELNRIDGSLQETHAWSYEHIETNPDLAFIEQTYGQAEGLAVKGKDVYIIFDNNLGGRQRDPGDRRPLFVHARMTD